MTRAGRLGSIMSAGRGSATATCSDARPPASLIGARGIGELGATGVDAAVAAAVFDAVGVRVRELPILPWKVLQRS